MARMTPDGGQADGDKESPRNLRALLTLPKSSKWGPSGTPLPVPAKLLLYGQISHATVTRLMPARERKQVLTRGLACPSYSLNSSHRCLLARS